MKRQIIEINRDKCNGCGLCLVPCCKGLMNIVEEAVKKSRKDIAIKKVVVGIEGEIS